MSSNKLWIDSFLSSRNGVIFSFIGLILSIIGLCISPACKQIDVSLVLLIIALILIITALVISSWKNKIQFYKSRDEIPKNLKVDSILKKIEKNSFNITIAGRTCIEWFKDIEEKKKLYEKAIKKGCRIKFIIQRHDVKNINIKDEEINEKIVREYKEIIESYKSIYNYLEGNSCPNVYENYKMLLTQHPVNNSITYIEKNGSNVQFSYDIGLNIKQNPMLVFRKDSLLPELLELLKYFEKESKNLFDYENKYNKANIEIDNIIKKYSQSSIQRNNHNKNLIYHYYKKRDSYKEGYFYPPISIQLLITNKCTTQCIMCSHHSINSENELRLPEIELTLDYIKDLGTKNIIISGGEPLYREDFLQILEKAKANDLNIGLLTNGIKYGGESITNKDAQKIKETCDWIQLSIDSFNDSNYAKIRNYDINIVKQSLTNLQAARLENKIEIAFTIQRDNIDEAIQIIKTEENAFNTPIYIRFKFAHGYDNENKFLLSDKKTELNEFLRNCKKSEKFNTEYISKMFTDGYFNIDDTIKGTPLSTRNNIFNKDGFICHVLNYSCKIDAKGDIYPCCFLFDDNKGENSQIRKEHKLGSLRDKNGIIPPLEDGHNLLKEILATKIPSYSKLIPIHDEACNNCIRHFYQNAFFNDFHKVNEDNKDINFIYSDSETADTLNTEIWL